MDVEKNEENKTDYRVSVEKMNRIKKKKRFREKMKKEMKKVRASARESVYTYYYVQ